MKRVEGVAFLPRNPTDEDIQRFVDFINQPIRKRRPEMTAAPMPSANTQMGILTTDLRR